MRKTGARVPSRTQGRPNISRKNPKVTRRGRSKVDEAKKKEEFKITPLHIIVTLATGIVWVALFVDGDSNERNTARVLHEANNPPPVERFEKSPNPQRQTVEPRPAIINPEKPNTDSKANQGIETKDIFFSQKLDREEEQILRKAVRKWHNILNLHPKDFYHNFLNGQGTITSPKDTTIIFSKNTDNSFSKYLRRFFKKSKEDSFLIMATPIDSRRRNTLEVFTQKINFINQGIDGMKKFIEDDNAKLNNMIVKSMHSYFKDYKGKPILILSSASFEDYIGGLGKNTIYMMMPGNPKHDHIIKGPMTPNEIYNAYRKTIKDSGINDPDQEAIVKEYFSKYKLPKEKVTKIGGLYIMHFNPEDLSYYPPKN